MLRHEEFGPVLKIDDEIFRCEGGVGYSPKHRIFECLADDRPLYSLLGQEIAVDRGLCQIATFKSILENNISEFEHIKG